MDKRTYLHLKHQNYRTTSTPPPPAVAREVELEHYAQLFVGVFVVDADQERRMDLLYRLVHAEEEVDSSLYHTAQACT